MLYPNLGRLALPTGGNADGKKRERTEPSAELVLAAVEARAAAARKAPELMVLVEQDSPDEWDEQTLRAVNEYMLKDLDRQNMSHRYEVYVNGLEFRHPEEREISAMVKRAEALMVTAQETDTERQRLWYAGRRDIEPVDRRLFLTVQHAINKIFLARVRRMDSSFLFDPASYERSVARLNDATQSLQRSVDALKRAVHAPSSAPKPSLVVNIPRAAVRPSQPYDSDDEPPTPPGFD